MLFCVFGLYYDVVSLYHVPWSMLIGVVVVNTAYRWLSAGLSFAGLPCCRSAILRMIPAMESARHSIDGCFCDDKANMNAHLDCDDSHQIGNALTPK